jgi:putative DNA primase/helicase
MKGMTKERDFFAEFAGQTSKPREVFPAYLLPSPTGSGKSQAARDKAVKALRKSPKQAVVIAVPRHALGKEQVDQLKDEHPNAKHVTAAIWRGRFADDPEIEGKKMCWRPDDVKELERVHVDIERNLCKQGRGDTAIKCPFYDDCGSQRQKHQNANLWFVAHELLVHEKPSCIGDLIFLAIDESPLDAFVFGIDDNDRIELSLDALLDPVPEKLFEAEAKRLKKAREALHGILSGLTVPTDQHKGVPVPKLMTFPGAESIGELVKMEWRGKVDPKISPNMSKKEIIEAAKGAESNAVIAKRVMLWELVKALIHSEVKVCGRVQVHRGGEGNGRVIRMVGVREIAAGWNAPMVVLDATGDVEVLKHIWPKIVVLGTLNRLEYPHVKIYQVVDRSMSKYTVAIESKSDNEKELTRKAKAARRMYAALLLKALPYANTQAAGEFSVGAIIYKSTEKWIKENCFVPKWLKLAHHGDVTGSNDFENVAAHFVIGRALPPEEIMTRQAEALSGEYIAERKYVEGTGEILIDPPIDGFGAVEVQQYHHLNELAERLRWQVMEGGTLQALERARMGLRTATDPLAAFLWTDVPVDALGPVSPMVWEEIEADVSLGVIMLASGGAWLENRPDAEKAYAGIVTAEGLKSEAKREVEGFLYIESIIRESPPPLLVKVTYKRAGPGYATSRAVFMADVADPRGWLVERLGPIASFEVGWPGNVIL